MSGIKIGVVQAKAVHLDLKSSIERAQDIIAEASNSDLVVFGETWLTGYPAWIDYGKDLNHWNAPELKEAYRALIEQSPAIHSPEIKALQSAARNHKCAVYMGLHERSLSTRSLYNSIIGISKEGQIVFHHRKMVPTFTEKLLHKPAEKFDLTIHQINGFNIGALICWEHWMPLARQYYHDQNEEIHLALWPSVHEMHQIASRHYAFEGRCYVIAVGQVMDYAEVPDIIALAQLPNRGDKLLRGGSCVIGPDGHFVIPPLFDQEEIIYVVIEDKSLIYQESITMDVSGHYGRQDLFNFEIK